LGWLHYRTNHLGPELKSFLEFQYNYEDIKAQVMGDMAYATLKYSIAIKMNEREVSGESLATAMLVKKAGRGKFNTCTGPVFQNENINKIHELEK